MTPAVPIFFDVPVRYADALELQEALVSARQREQIPDTVLFLEHRSVITLGRRGRSNFLLAKPEQIASRGIDFFTSSRGGDVTFHGPGQLVMYPILKLGSAEADAHGYLENLEEVAIQTATDFGVAAFRRDGMNGAWTDSGKIAAIGFHLKRWVSMHGMSFNVDLDLNGFELIVGCGLIGEKVSSLKNILGERCPPLGRVRESMAAKFQTICGRDFSLLADFPMLEKIVSACRIRSTS